MQARNFCLSFVATVFICSVAYSESITVQDSSFQTPALSDGVTNGEQYDLNQADFPAWTGAGPGVFGIDNPSATMYARAANGPLPGTADGTQFGLLNLDITGGTNSFTYSGSTLGNFVAGQIYMLTVAIGGRLDEASYQNQTDSITLLANGLAVGTPGTGSPITGTFYDLTETFTATAGQNGEAIGILLSAISGNGFQQANFDNVRLSIVPEPGSLTLFGLGAIGLFLAVRRGRKG